MTKRVSLAQLNSLKKRELLDLRFCELDMDVQDTWLAPYVDRLYDELERAGFMFLRPKTYFGDEWFCPEHSTLISIPFFLAHHRLAKLEKDFSGKVEGYSHRQIMKLLRHETGHCFNYAYQLYRHKTWQKLFGNTNATYDVENYEYQPGSKNFVRHLGQCYAQSHPDEDFAETFAVWLAPRSEWQTRYEEWPVARRKLMYIEHLVNEYAHQPLMSLNGARPLSHIRQLQSTIGRFYRRRML